MVRAAARGWLRRRLSALGYRWASWRYLPWDRLLLLIWSRSGFIGAIRLLKFAKEGWKMAFVDDFAINSPYSLGLRGRLIGLNPVLHDLDFGSFFYQAHQL